MKREQLIQERELVLAEKTTLQMKILRSSQIVSKVDLTDSMLLAIHVLVCSGV